jgi:hypothetical protein
VDITNEDSSISFFVSIDDPDGRTFQPFTITMKLTNGQHPFSFNVNLLSTGGNNFEGKFLMAR